jgi:hypothetical protein
MSQVTATVLCPTCLGGARHAKTKAYEASVGLPHRNAFFPAHCKDCRGTTKIIIDPVAIGQAITTNKGTLKKSMSSTTPGLPYGAYWVWRYARFYGGADTTMPVTADFTTGTCFPAVGDVKSDAVPVLESLAKTVAMTYFGTVDGAARVWQRAMGVGR